MVTAPTPTPVTVPEEEPIDTINGLLLVHVPPPDPSVSVLVLPILDSRHARKHRVPERVGAPLREGVLAVSA